MRTRLVVFHGPSDSISGFCLDCCAAANFPQANKTSSVVTKTMEYVGVSTGKDWYLTFNFHHVQCAAESTAFRC